MHLIWKYLIMFEVLKVYIKCVLCKQLDISAVSSFMDLLSFTMKIKLSFVFYYIVN